MHFTIQMHRNIFLIISVCRGVCDLLDSWSGSPANGWSQLPQLQRDEIKTLAAASGRGQFCHEPLHLLLQGRGDVDHFQKPPALHLQRHSAAAVVQGQRQASELWSRYSH